MNSYCDSEYYLETYGGTIVPQDKLDTWLLLASNKIRMAILGRNITGYEELVKQCTCSIADELFSQNTRRQETMKSGPIASESVGDYSRTFANTTAEETKGSNSAAVLNLLDLYLGCTGLLYRGLSV